MRKAYLNMTAAVAIATLSLPTDRDLVEELDAIRDPKEGGARCPKCKRHFKTDNGLAMHLNTYHRAYIGVDLASVSAKPDANTEPDKNG